jgi:hypothetical protein
MSPSVMTLPARNFKFLTEGSLERTRNYRLCEKEGRVEIGAVTLGFRFQIPLINASVRFSATGFRCVMSSDDPEFDDRGLMPVFDFAQNHFEIFADQQLDFACNRDRRRRHHRRKSMV